MASILLTRGYYAIVDEEDVAWLSERLWSYHNGYAATNVPNGRGGYDYVTMHNAIAERHGLIFIPELDHFDRNGLNNQKSNFRAATRQMQNANRGLRSDNKSGCPGVYRRKGRSKYDASIRINGVKWHLGSFVNYDDAVAAYEKAKKEYSV